MKIWKPVHDRIVQAARGTDGEIIGLLLGRLQANAIVIEDSVTGESTSEPHTASLSPNAIAKIADALVNGRLKGNIVGWYHSHTEGGLFFSATDIATQQRLQQFSTLIIGMVVDTSTGEDGYFRVDPQTGEALRTSPENIEIYTQPTEIISAGKKPAPATTAIEVRRRTTRGPQSRVIIAAVLLGLLVSAIAFGLVLYGAQYPTKLSIDHTPVTNGTIGTPIQITASVTGPVHNVTLAYAATANPSFARVMMDQISGSSGTGSQSHLYGYTIPGAQVNGNIAYYIAAFGTIENEVTTRAYQVTISDFNIVPKNAEVTVYRNSTQQFGTQINFMTVNGFTQPVMLSAVATPLGMGIAFRPNPIQSGMSLVYVSLSADQTASTGTSSVSILATYVPANSTPVTRQTTLAITVADFDLAVNPTLRETPAGSSTAFNLTLTFQKGFSDSVSIKLAGLPEGVRYQLTSNVTSIGGTGSTTMTLQILASTLAKPGTYLVTITATGAGVSHSQTISLIVR